MTIYPLDKVTKVRVYHTITSVMAGMGTLVLIDPVTADRRSRTNSQVRWAILTWQ